MNKILITGCMVFAAFAAVAMPNKKELARAQRFVEDVTSADLKALKAGKLTAKEVADNHMSLAAKAENDAERYLLLQGAFKLYSRDADYDSAAEALTVMSRDIKDFPPEVTIEIISEEMRRVAWEKAPKVFTIFKAAKRDLQRQKDSVAFRKALKADTCVTEIKDAKESANGYTWSYRVRNGEATIMAEKDRRHSCAVSPTPTGDVKIPAILGGVKVTRIGWEAFRNCRMLTSVTIPEGVTHIDTHAFGYCDGLKSVTLPSSLKDVGYAAFGKCAELTSVTIPNGVKSIGADAFNGCRKIKSLVIPESVTHIGDRAFSGCGELESVSIPAGVASLGNGVFGACNALKTINVDSGSQSFTSINGALYTKNRTELVMYPNPPASVVMPKGVTKIRGWAFAGGKEMTSVTIPEGVTNIGDVAFRECSGLKSITIPSSVKKIEEHAFLRCGALTDVTMLGERPELQKDNIFDGCGKLKSIHVPAKAKSWTGMKEWMGIPLVFDAK